MNRIVTTVMNVTIPEEYFKGEVISLQSIYDHIDKVLGLKGFSRIKQYSLEGQLNLKQQWDNGVAGIKINVTNEPIIKTYIAYNDIILKYRFRSYNRFISCNDINTLRSYKAEVILSMIYRCIGIETWYDESDNLNSEFVTRVESDILKNYHRLPCLTIDKTDIVKMEESIRQIFDSIFARLDWEEEFDGYKYE